MVGAGGVASSDGVTLTLSRAMTPAVPPTLHDLAMRAAAGDTGGTEQLLVSVRRMVHRYCRARLGSLPGADQAAEDAAQEVCIAVLKGLPAYRDTGRPFEAFVYRIASRRVADAQRSAYRGAVPVGEVPDSVSSDPTPEEAALMRADADRARRLLERLPVQQREIVTLRVAAGLSAEEVGRALGMTSGAVRVAQHRALQRLRAYAAAEAGGAA